MSRGTSSLRGFSSWDLTLTRSRNKGGLLGCAAMTSVQTVLYLGVCLSAGIITTADENVVPKAENVYWHSLDFKTTLIWTATPPDHKYLYTVWYSRDGADWREAADCIRLSETHCDLTNELLAINSSFSADIKTEPFEDYDYYDPEAFPHTFSLPFNPIKDSNISAVNFTVEAVDEHSVMVNITDPLTSIHQQGKQLRLKDVLKNKLKYKIIYFKSGSTGKRETIFESSAEEVPNLDPGESYCFMVAAYIPSRPKSTQQGAWSTQTCTDSDFLPEPSVGWVGAILIILAVLIIIVTATVLCYRCSRQKNPSQSSTPV